MKTSIVPTRESRKQSHHLATTHPRASMCARELRTRMHFDIDHFRLWGLDLRRLHDLYWAARGMQVIRPGCPPDPAGPRAYLLLQPNQAVLARATPWLSRLAWTGAVALRVRVSDPSQLEYHERVVSTDNGDLLRIERVYPQSKSSSSRRAGGGGTPIGRIIVTTDEDLSKRWADVPLDAPSHHRWSSLNPKRRDESNTTRVIRRRPARQWRQMWAVWSGRGRLFDLSTERDCERLLADLMHNWKDPGRVIPGVYQFKPGVWIHESVRIAEHARLVAPLWIGAVSGVVGAVGPKYDGGETDHTPLEIRAALIGPRAHPDTRECEAPAQIDWESLRLPSFPLAPRIRGGLSRRVSKRAFDITFSLAVIVATAPIYPLLIAAVLIEDGRPVFFGHRRQTIGGREFNCWKFRTMVKNAEAMKVALQAQNVCDGPQFYVVNDPRLLRVGALMRKFQLDELPQFFNVLMGHMSVVGPRPSPDKENQFCPAWREARLSVRPGITGLWQVRRTRVPETDFQEWIRYDLEYVQHQSWRMDFWIIMRTVRKVFGL